MADITNFTTIGLTKIDDDKKGPEIHEDIHEIHIRVKKRNGKKCITTVENLNVISQDPVFWKNLFKYFKKQLCCNGSLDEQEKSMLLFGDQREKVKQYLLDKKLCIATDIKVHGF